MISTLIRVGSVILLIIIFTNIWAQKRDQQEAQNKQIEQKKNKNKNK